MVFKVRVGGHSQLRPEDAERVNDFFLPQQEKSKEKSIVLLFDFPSLVRTVIEE